MSFSVRVAWYSTSAGAIAANMSTCARITAAYRSTSCATANRTVPITPMRQLAANRRPPAAPVVISVATAVACTASNGSAMASMTAAMAAMRVTAVSLAKQIKDLFKYSMNPALIPCIQNFAFQRISVSRLWESSCAAIMAAACRSARCAMASPIARMAAMRARAAVPSPIAAQSNARLVPVAT